MANENNSNEYNNSNNNFDNTQNPTTNHCSICNAPIPQNEKLCNNCKSVYATSNNSNDNISTNMNNQNNSYNQFNPNNNSINNNTNNNYNNGNFIQNQNPNNYSGNGNNYATNKSKMSGFNKSFRKHKSVYIGVIIGIVVIVLAIFLISSLTSYKRTIRTYLDIEILGKTELLLNMVPEEYIELNYDDEEDFIESNEKYIEKAHESLIDKYGDNLKYSFEITKEKELSNSKYDNLCDALKSDLDIGKKEIGKAYDIEFEYSVEGDDDSEDGWNMEIVAIQIHGKWYLLICNSSYSAFCFLI